MVAGLAFSVIALGINLDRNEVDEGLAETGLTGAGLVVERFAYRVRTRMSPDTLRTMMRAPTDSELDALTEQFVREEVLYREAIRLGLDRDDAVLRKRRCRTRNGASSASQFQYIRRAHRAFQTSEEIRMSARRRSPRPTHLATAILLGLAIPGVVFAQEEAPATGARTLDTVTVTGSRMSRS